MGHYSGRFEHEEQRFYPVPLPPGWFPSVTTIGKQVKQIPLGWPAKMTGIGMANTLRLIKEGKIEPSQLTNAKIEELVKHAKSLYNKKSESGMDLGTRVHSWAEQFYSSKIGLGEAPPDASGDMEKPVHAMLEWDNKHHLMPAYIEKFVWSERKYAGSFDSWGETDRGKTLCDLKVSGAHYPSDQVMQLGAYSYALTEREGVLTDAHVILRLDKETGMPDDKWYSENEVEIGWRRFFKLVEYWWETHWDMDIALLAKNHGGRET